MQVKVCNFRSNEFEHDFIRSVIETGFAVITHHGIDHGLIHQNQDVWRHFFKQSLSEKSKFANPEDTNIGYNAFGVEKAVGANVSDLKEFFHWKPGKALPTEVSLSTQRMFYLLEDHIGSQLLRIIDDYGRSNWRSACQGSDNTVLRTLYYPALSDVKAEPGSVRAAAHEDINFITLLVAASAPGLQVMDKGGKWYDVPNEANSIIVNIGDMLQLASNGVFKSTTHRVVNPDDSSSDRVSMPLFIHANGDTLLTPGFTAQQYLNQRLNAIYQSGYGKGDGTKDSL